MYLSKELLDGCLASFHESLLNCRGAQDVVRGNTGLTSIDALAPHDTLSHYINVCIVSHNAGAEGKRRMDMEDHQPMYYCLQLLSRLV